MNAQFLAYHATTTHSLERLSSTTYDLIRYSSKYIMWGREKSFHLVETPKLISQKSKSKEENGIGPIPSHLKAYILKV